MEVDATRVVDVLDGESILPWSSELARIDTVPAGGRRKVYVHPDDHVNRVVLTVPGHGRLTMRWDVDRAPYLGLWFDNGCYARSPVIAIEPTTGYFDSLETAVANQRVLWLESGAEPHWWIEVTVDAVRAA